VKLKKRVFSAVDRAPKARSVRKLFVLRKAFGIPLRSISFHRMVVDFEIDHKQHQETTIQRKLMRFDTTLQRRVDVTLGAQAKLVNFAHCLQIFDLQQKMKQATMFAAAGAALEFVCNWSSVKAIVVAAVAAMIVSQITTVCLQHVGEMCYIL
jgi:hypothetical protein